jgi:hypothetical protein
VKIPREKRKIHKVSSNSNIFYSVLCPAKLKPSKVKQTKKRCENNELEESKY